MINDIANFLSQSENQLMLMTTAEMFLQLFVELSLLFLVISYLVSLINQRLSTKRIQQLLGAKKGRGYIMAAGLGAITPFCSCSTVPMLIGLLKARAGFGPTMTFLFTSPLLNPVVIALFIPVLGLQITAWYAIFALSASIIAGVLLNTFGFERFVKQEMVAPVPSASESNEGCVVDYSIWKKAWQECWSLFRSMFPYMLIAMIIGAIVHGFVPADFFANIAGADNPAAIPTAALVGIPLYIRVTALMPLVSSFIAKGVSMGAIIALVIGSGGASLPEVILLKRLFYWPLLIAFLGVIFSMAVIGGLSINHLYV